MAIHDAPDGGIPLSGGQRSVSRWPFSGAHAARPGVTGDQRARHRPGQQGQQSLRTLRLPLTSRTPLSTIVEADRESSCSPGQCSRRQHTSFCSALPCPQARACRRTPTARATALRSAPPSHGDTARIRKSRTLLGLAPGRNNAGSGRLLRVCGRFVVVVAGAVARRAAIMLLALPARAQNRSGGRCHLAQGVLRRAERTRGGAARVATVARSMPASMHRALLPRAHR